MEKNTTIKNRCLRWINVLNPFKENDIKKIKKIYNILKENKIEK